MKRSLFKTISSHCWIFVFFFSIFQVHMYGKTVQLSNSILTNNSMQQRMTATGRIVDQKGEPIIGATIIEKENRTNGTVSDENGNFTLEVGNNSSLVISFIGYRII
ncbi:MAG: carboxypeptidase-like regulatory domain-containing protein, partial [Bacteroidaceae bacterium]|nr:carboxypeptidase-like regulatory domain-containing protein [Bacteroidaceae bacterium]